MEPSHRPANHPAAAPKRTTSGPDSPLRTAAPQPSVEACLARLAAGDGTAADALIELACGRMRAIAHRMLGRYPSVRRYDDTDDVVQNSLLRLHRALNSVSPETPERFLGLAALQIRRELLDLARRYAGPESAAAHHETDSIHTDGETRSRVAEAQMPLDPTPEIDRWTRLHEAVAALPEEERRLFELAWYLGCSQEETARLLSCSVRTVKRRWEQVKLALRASLPGGPAGSPLD